MPGHKQHCEDCERKLGKPFPEVHAWLDAFYGRDGDVAHRSARHHLEGIEEVRRLWGDEAARAAILHIMLDWDGIREDQIPRNQKEAEEFTGKWLASLPRLEDQYGRDTKNTESEVVETVLASFQKDLRHFRPGLLARLLSRQPKRQPVGYAQQFSSAGATGRMAGPVQGVWRVTAEAVERMPAGFSVPEPERGTRRYGCTYFSFTLPDESGTGALACQSGPRSGFGFRYRVKAGNVEMAGESWVS